MPSHSHPRIHARAKRQPVDRAMDVMAVVSPLLGVPQAVQIFVQRDAAGLSLFSWLAFAAVAAVFLLYALKHRIKPLIIAESLWLAVYAAVIPGILIYG